MLLLKETDTVTNQALGFFGRYSKEQTLGRPGKVQVLTEVEAERDEDAKTSCCFAEVRSLFTYWKAATSWFKHGFNSSCSRLLELSNKNVHRAEAGDKGKIKAPLSAVVQKSPTDKPEQL